MHKRSNETSLKIDYGQLHIRIERHVAKTSLFCAPREKFWHRGDRLFSSKDTTASLRSHAAILSKRALESTLMIFVRPDLLELVGILFELPTPANGKK